MRLHEYVSRVILFMCTGDLKIRYLIQSTGYRDGCGILVDTGEGDYFFISWAYLFAFFFYAHFQWAPCFSPLSASIRWAPIIGYNPKRAMLTGHQPAHFRFFVKRRLKMIAGCCKGLGRSEMRNQSQCAYQKKIFVTINVSTEKFVFSTA